RLDVEHHEEQGEDVIADVALAPAGADGVHAALGVQVLLGLGAGGTDEAPGTQHEADHEDGRPAEYCNGEVLTEEVRHQSGNLVNGFTSFEIQAGRRGRSRRRVAIWAKSKTAEGRKPTTRVKPTASVRERPAPTEIGIWPIGKFASAPSSSGAAMYITTMRRR